MKNTITLLFLFITIMGYSQKEEPIKSETDLNEINQKEVLDSLTEKLGEFYIKPNSIDNIRKKLNENYKKGNYKKLINPKEYATKLTTDLLEISNDLHFYIMYDPQWVNDQMKSKDENAEKKIKAQELEKSKKNNFGFRQVEILEGNVGYLRFDYFHDPAEASETASSIMQFLSNTDALIIDLRTNNGGAMEMGQFISSYFFSDKELPLYKYYYYENKRKKIDREMWLLPSVPGDRLENVTIYILTSSATFSAAEWMSYSLQNLKRAIIVGEQTAGGAHPVARKILTHGFSINIPFGEIKDPITQLDFEGRGITPDVPTKSKDALNTAHLLALQNISSKNKDAAATIDWLIPIIKNREKPTVVDSLILKSYQGKYGKGVLKYENDNLYYKWNNTVNFLLTPLEQDFFLVDGIDDFRIKIILENNTIVGIKRVYQDGQEREYLKE
jgi:hypothetical protein